MRFGALLLLLAGPALAQPTQTPVSHAAFLGGQAGDRVRDIAFGPRGNVYIVGSTGAANFAGGAPLIGPGGDRDSFVVKLNPSLTEILYAVRIGGSGFDSPVDLSLDENGAAYVVGSTSSGDLPVSDGVFRPEPRFLSTSFLFKLTPEGELDLLTYVGVTDIRRVKLDSSQKIWLAGATGGILDFPFTDDALRTVFDNDVCFTGRTFTVFNCVDGFLMRLSPGASTVEYATSLGARGSDSIFALEFGPDGDVYVGGFTTSDDFPRNPTVFSPPADVAGKAYALRLDPTGATVRQAWQCADSTASVRDLRVLPSGELRVIGDLGRPGAVGSSAGISLQPQGTFVQVISPTGDRQLRFDRFAVAEGFGWGLDNTLFLASQIARSGDGRVISPLMRFVTRLDQNGTVVVDRAPVTALGPLLAVARDGALYMAGLGPANAPETAGARIRASFGEGPFGAVVARTEPRPRAFVSRVENAASLEGGRFKIEIAGGEILTLRGEGLGPERGIEGLGVELAGLQVTIDDTPAPLLWAQNRQVNLIAPWSLNPTCRQSGCASLTSRISVLLRGIPIATVDVGVAPAVPGVFTDDFTGRGQIVMLNEDGSQNSHFNPARAGEFVTFWGTGLGPMQPPGVDGRVQGNERVLVTAVLPVRVTMKDIPAEVRFAGLRPGMLHGLFEIQAVVPSELEASSGHRLRVEVEGRLSQDLATISVE